MLMSFRVAISTALLLALPMAVEAQTRVKTWGANNTGQLGIGTTTGSNTPVQIAGLQNVAAVACGDGHVLAQMADGTMRSWGFNSQGQLGMGSAGAPQLNPVSVVLMSDVVAVAAAYRHSMALKSDGTVWTCGWNPFGELGQQVGGQANQFGQVVYGMGNVASISAGPSYSMIRKNDSTVWLWGYNFYQQFGNPLARSVSLPPIQMNSGASARAISAGTSNTAVLQYNGTILTCGPNYYGALGNGSFTTPPNQQLSQVVGINNAVKIAVGGGYMLALLADGTVAAWGLNDYGQVGNGTTTNQNLPVAVQGLSAIVDIAAGGSFSAAIGADGTVYTWGRNDSGQLGDGTLIERHLPAPINLRAISINCGTAFAAAIVPVCVGDIAPNGGDESVNIDDLVLVITSWGALGGPADITGDGIVDIDDLVQVITHWGGCP